MGYSDINSSYYTFASISSKIKIGAKGESKALFKWVKHSISSIWT